MKYGTGVIERLPSGRVRVRIPDGKGKYKSLGTYDSEAQARVMLDAGHAVKASSSVSQNVAQYGEIVIMRWRAAGKRSWKDDWSRWKCWVVAHADWANDAVDQVTRADAKRFARELLSYDLSNQTIKHVVNLARSVFHEAVDTDEIIERNPFEGVEVPQRSSTDQDHWTALSLQEIEQLRTCPTFTAEQRTVFLLAVYTGLRQGELAALEWSDVNLDGAPHLWVRRSWNTPTTKTSTSRRVDLIPAAVVLMNEWRGSKRVSSKYVWGCLYARGYDWGWALKKDNKNGVCYLGAKREAGIVRSVWFHHLRDTCASHLLTGSWGRAWSIAEVAQLLGHTSTWVTERYARIMPGALARAAAETSHESPTRPERFTPQVLETTGRAMGDSNTRQPAPEAERSVRTSDIYELRGRSVGDLTVQHRGRNARRIGR